MAVVKKFGEDQAGNLAALVAYYAFFSLFPLLLVSTTILGFVLSGDPSALPAVRHSVLGQFPVIGDSLKGRHLSGNVAGLAIGIVLSLLAGLGVTQAMAQALDRVWGVPRQERANFLASRLRGLAMLVAIGAVFVIASGASGAVSGGLGGPALKVSGIVFAVVVNFALFMISFQALSSIRLSWNELVPGAALAAVLWTVLQSVGGVYIDQIKNSGRYGTFALVIGVLAWIHLGAQMTLYSVELNSVLSRRLWPRSLFSDDPTPPKAPDQRDG